MADYATSLLVCKNRAIFQTLCADEDPGNIITGDDEKVNVQEVGTVYLKFDDGTIKKTLNVRYVLDLSKNVLSPSDAAIMRAELQLYRGRSLVLQRLMNKKNIYF